MVDYSQGNPTIFVFIFISMVFSSWEIGVYAQDSALNSVKGATSSQKPIPIYIYNKFSKNPKSISFFLALQKNKWGIPNGSRARPVLFQTKTLQKSTTAYPSIGQKKLNGASSRLMVHFAASIAADIAGSHENETYRRHWPKAIQIFFIYLCAVFW